LPSDRTLDDEGETIYGKQAMTDWARELEKTANDAFYIATRSLDGSSRALKAVAVAERGFRGRLREALKSYLGNNNQTETIGGEQ
jgi:hypothetical protein